jgi:hypothetical protein
MTARVSVDKAALDALIDYANQMWLYFAQDHLAGVPEWESSQSELTELVAALDEQP